MTLTATFRAKTFLGFTAFRFKMARTVYWNKNNLGITRGGWRGYFTDVNSTHEVDNHDGGTAKPYVTLEAYWVQEDRQYFVHIQGHVENCVVMSAGPLCSQFYPWLKVYSFVDPFALKPVLAVEGGRT